MPIGEHVAAEFAVVGADVGAGAGARIDAAG